MGFKFRRSVKIAPGVRLNLTHKSGSVRLGPRGLGYTVSTTGRKHVSAGLPGTGLYMSERVDQRFVPPSQQKAPRQSANWGRALWVAACFVLLIIGLASVWR